jgi:hypothetical protein
MNVPAAGPGPVAEAIVHDGQPTAGGQQAGLRGEKPAGSGACVKASMAYAKSAPIRAGASCK